MVSTRSRAGVNKQADAGPSRPTNITPDLATILDGQVKMQQELANLKKCSTDEMEALQQENYRLKRKIEAAPTKKGKAKEASEVARSPAFQPTKEESEYNPTPHTFTPPNKNPFPQPISLTSLPSYQGTPRPLPLPLPSPPPTSPTIYPPPYTLPMPHLNTHTTSLRPTSPLTTSPPPFPLLSTIPFPPTQYHHTNPDVATRSPTSSSTPPFPPSRNPSHWTATLVKPTSTNNLKSTSPMLPCTPPKTQSSTKPFPLPSKALLSNGSQSSHLTQSTTLTPSHTCSQPISLAAAHIKLLQSPS